VMVYVRHSITKTQKTMRPQSSRPPMPPVVRWAYIRSDLLGSIYHATLYTKRQRTDWAP